MKKETEERLKALGFKPEMNYWVKKVFTELDQFCYCFKIEKDNIFSSSSEDIQYMQIIVYFGNNDACNWMTLFTEKFNESDLEACLENCYDLLYKKMEKTVLTAASLKLLKA